MAPDECGEIALEAGEGEHADVRTRLELDEDVDVAVGAKVEAEDGAEEPEAGDVVALANGGDAAGGEEGDY